MVRRKILNSTLVRSMSLLALSFIFVSVSVRSEVKVDADIEQQAALSASVSGDVFDAIAALDQRMSALSHLKTTFAQTTYAADQQLVQTSEGKLWLSPGGKFRIETISPFEQILISDGLDLWTIDRDLEQTTIRNLEKDLKQVPILMFDTEVSELAKEYQVDFFVADDLDVFVLSPIAVDALFEVLSISFHRVEMLPVKIEIRDSLGQRSVIDFIDLIVSDQAELGVYAYVEQLDFDVIDDR